MPGCLLVMLDRRLVFLPAEVGVAEQRQRAFILREETNQLGVVLQRAGGIGLQS